MRHHVGGEHKAKKGLIRIEFDERDGKAERVRITGGFLHASGGGCSGARKEA